MKSLKLILIGTMLLGVSGLSAAKKEKKHIGTPELMGQIHGSIIKILPHSVGYVGFSSKANRLMLAEEIGKLEELGQELKKSTKGKDEAFELIANNFSDDVKELAVSFKSESYRHARFVFQNITSNCISCHTRESGNSSFNKVPLYDSLSSSKLSKIEKAELNTAIRKFDLAMDQYEDAFAKGNISKINSILLEGYVIDYMILGLKVKNEPKRVMKTLESIGYSPVVPVSLQKVVSKWVGFLKNYNGKKDYGHIDTVISLYERGQSLNTHPFDSSSALAAILVEKHLQDLLHHEEKMPKMVKSKAYLLYGLSEISLSRPNQLSKAAFFLEKAILSYPKSDTAKEAYAVLEDHIYFENSGSSGVNVPKNLLDKLEKLKKQL